jgi:hypothetical protein
MKSIKNTILEELIKLTEINYQAPPEILNTLKGKLKMDPLIRYVKSLKAVNSIPPSYEIRLLNGQYFEIYYEDFSLMIKIGAKEYYVMDMSERSEAIEHINRLLTIRPVTSPSKPEGEEEAEGETTPPPTSPSPAPTSGGGKNSDVAMEPDEEEPAEEPAEEPDEEEPTT